MARDRQAVSRAGEPPGFPGLDTIDVSPRSDVPPAAEAFERTTVRSVVGAAR
jgi:hypothetical protein